MICRSAASTPAGWQLICTSVLQNRRAHSSLTSLPAASRMSNMFLPTRKDVTDLLPTDPHSSSSSATQSTDIHRLMLRAGLIRQSSPGMYSLLPLGFRAVSKICGIIEDELDAIGSQQLRLPHVLSADLWKRTGRWESTGSELFRLVDRRNNDYCLAPTHEEEITSIIANEVSSYRQLPLRLYQIGYKYRDERRPRGGLLRAREFLMKDLYSFDSTPQAASETYEQVVEAYRRIMTRLSVPFVVAEADTGNIGGKRSHEFHFVSQKGEDVLLTCRECGYTANTEMMKGVVRLEDESVKRTYGEISEAVRNAKLNEDVTKGGMDVFRLASADGVVAAAVVPKGRQPCSVKVGKVGILQNAEGKSVEWTVSSWDWSVHGLPSSSSSSSSSSLKAIIVDHSLISESNDASGECVADIVESVAGDLCPKHDHSHNVHNEAVLESSRATEIGHTFLLGTRYSSALEARIKPPPSAESPNNEPLVPIQMGCYGIGITRLLPALLEATGSGSSSQIGLRWPLATAPLSMCILPLPQSRDQPDSDPAVKAAIDLHSKLAKALPSTVSGKHGIVIDDRLHLSPGYRLNDARLIGFPWVIVIGKKSLSSTESELKYEVQEQVFGGNNSTSLLTADEIIERVKQFT
ncbi:prolyl-tRNA synthetase [Ramicandelaber brevisporus]|nr:prolyl-tRNA synthetase [Ramicandelaber brevisporus]